EVTVYSEVFDAHRNKLKVDEPLIIEGKVSKDDFRDGLRIVAENLYTLPEARTRFARQLRLSMNGQADARKLQELLTPFRMEGGCPVRIAYRNGEAQCELILGEGTRVRPDDDLLQTLQDWLSPAGVELQYN
ncbi:MAG: DNA polymerase III subunit alpha, partial [Stutzerimonas stutzeri]